MKTLKYKIFFFETLNYKMHFVQYIYLVTGNNLYSKIFVSKIVTDIFYPRHPFFKLFIQIVFQSISKQTQM